MVQSVMTLDQSSVHTQLPPDVALFHHPSNCTFCGILINSKDFKFSYIGPLYISVKP